jgi:hypothetical protein
MTHKANPVTLTLKIAAQQPPPPSEPFEPFEPSEPSRPQGVSKGISTNPWLIHLPGLPDYMTREAKRPGERAFQFPRCTIHGSGKERPGTFMNFSSPARRKLHKNS